MQKYIVESVNELRSKDGEKVFYKVKMDDGTEMSCFDTAIKEVSPGSQIEAETKVKKSGNYTNITITEWKLRVPGQKQEPLPEVRPEYKNGKDTASIEAQVAVKAIFQLCQNGIPEGAEEVYKKAIAWCEKKIGGTTPLVKESQKIGQTSDTRFPHAGALFAECQKHGISRKEVLEIAGIKDNPESVSEMDTQLVWGMVCEAKNLLPW